jgi:hypothetical protein
VRTICVDDGDIAYDIVTGPVASDDAYLRRDRPADVAVVNADNDAAGIAVTPVAGWSRARPAPPRRRSTWS